MTAWAHRKIAGPGLWMLGCSVGLTANTGSDEPLIVHSAQFIAGALPGLPPPDGGPVQSPAIKTYNASNTVVMPGAANQGFGGTATSDGSSVAVRFADMGTGYWVVPLGIPALIPGQLSFAFTADFAATIPAGTHPLRVVAIDSTGHGGTAVDDQLCFQSRIPDNGHTCNPAIAAPAAVMTLAWDTNFDVDLHVILPDGLDVNPKDPLTVDPTVVDAGLNPSRIDRDSLGGCVPDGLRQEDLVFQTPPPAGLYDIYANPFASCGQADAHFTFTLYLLGDDGDLHVSGTPIAGELLGMQANGGTSDGLFVVEQQF